jgi:hypothetical protein
MDSSRFDRWTQSLSRRTVAGALGLGALGLPSLIEAKKKHKHKHKKKKKVKFNDFGCANVGGFCKNSGQCCSGICSGKKDKKKCQAHNVSTCTAGQHTGGCGGTSTLCTSSAGDEGVCETTTGNAGYCAVAGQCASCTKDADCIADFGPDAACIVCPDCLEFDTVCVGPEGGPPM